MTGEQKRCSECGGEMEEGFMPEKSRSMVVAARWLKGHPESSFWQGTKTEGRECRFVEAWRCTDCGFLKMYAIKEAEPPGLLSM